MTDDHFRVGERLWLRGGPVTFVGYHRYAPHLVDAAVVRRPDEKTTRVVPLAEADAQPGGKPRACQSTPGQLISSPLRTLATASPDVLVSRWRQTKAATNHNPA
jgi:hypothetical protein